MTYRITTDTSPSTRPRLRTAVVLAVATLATQGCPEATVPADEPLTLELDGESELHVSTYPSGLPRELSGIPFLYKELRSPDSVYFQVFVRDAEAEAGRNPHVESITIHSFSYALPGQEPLERISDYDHYFWMQGSPEYNPKRHAPVPVDEHWYVRLKIDLTLNVQRYAFDEQVHGAEVETLRPLLLYALK